MKIRSKPVTKEATQWFKNGDHPLDKSEVIHPADSEPFLSEGEVVRRYRTPDIRGDVVCTECGRTMHEHGWIDTLEGGHIVCVGDWIITGLRGEFYPCKPDIFEKSYEKVEE